MVISIHITFQRVQSLEPEEYGLQVQFAKCFLDQKVNEENFSEYILFTDNTYFSHDGVFNLQNNHMWHVNN